MSKSLVAFDTDRIKDYVFGTSRLKEIRGASALLDRLNRHQMRGLTGGREIYANGGAGLFVVDTERAEDAIREVQGVYRRQTKAASVTGVSVQLPEAAGEDVHTQLELVRHRLRLAKDGGTAPSPTLTHPLLRFCDSCGTGYADTRDEDDRPICASCRIKREESRGVEAEIEDWTVGRQSPDLERLWGRLIAGLKERGYPVSGYGRPDDFGALGDMSSPAGYMALIYADGDGMGSEVDQIKTLDDMEQFARVVDDAVYTATQEAIVDHLRPVGPQRAWPFDILLLGGDDLVMVTRAQSALPVALHIVERFPQLTKESLGKSLSLSASVVFTHTSYPIGSLMELTESGLAFAKERQALRRLRGVAPQTGLINFLVVNTTNHLSFKKHYEQHYREILRYEGQAEQRVLYRTQRPYGASEMRELLDKVRTLRELGIPHNKLEQLREAVFRSRRQAMLEAMMITLRIRNEDHRQALLGLVGSTDEDTLYFPWVKRDDSWMTPVLDVVDLFDFVR